MIEVDINSDVQKEDIEHQIAKLKAVIEGAGFRIVERSGYTIKIDVDN
jgi:hypothetical protein